MRYDFAAREFRRVETGVPAAPGEYLVIALRDIRTEAWTGEATPVATARTSEVLAVHRRALCKGDDPCHVYYDVAWSHTAARPARHEPPISGDITRYTRYSVALTLGPITRTYDAVVLYHDESGGVTATPEVIDPLVPDLDELAGDRAPLAKAPWKVYTKTRRYAAVAQKARAWHANPNARALTLPIGFIVGDDVTAQDETMVAMTAELCEAPACSCAAGGGMSDGEWNELKSSWPRLVRPQVCKMGPETGPPERPGSYNCMAWTLGQSALGTISNHPVRTRHNQQSSSPHSTISNPQSPIRSAIRNHQSAISCLAEVVSRFSGRRP